METNQDLLRGIFEKLSLRIADLNRERMAEGMLVIQKSEVTLLGQMSLLANEKAAMVLALAQTGDMDARLTMDHVVKEELKALLAQEGLVCDEDSHLIWIPPGASYEQLFALPYVTVKALDPDRRS